MIDTELASQQQALDIAERDRLKEECDAIYAAAAREGRTLFERERRHVAEIERDMLSLARRINQ